jgi:hypothetical protein
MRARNSLRLRVEDVLRGGPNAAHRQRQKERVAAALPLLTTVTEQTVSWQPAPALFSLLRRGLALGSAVTLGIAGSLIYESQVQSAAAEAPPTARSGRLSVWLGADLTADGGLSKAAPMGDLEAIQDGTILLPPCSSGRLRRR